MLMNLPNLQKRTMPNVGITCVMCLCVILARSTSKMRLFLRSSCVFSIDCIAISEEKQLCSVRSSQAIPVLTAKEHHNMFPYNNQPKRCEYF